MKIQRIAYSDFLRMFGPIPRKLSGEIKGRLESVNTEYRESKPEELEEYIQYVLKLIESPSITRSESENYKAWEEGWSEHLRSVRANSISMKGLKPKYFRPSKFFRYNKKLIITKNRHLEYDLFSVVRYFLFSKYLSGSERIYELGCGSCQNLLILAEMFPLKTLYGMDWSKASIRIANLLGERCKGKINEGSGSFPTPHEPSGKNKKKNSPRAQINGILLDMLNPSKKVKIEHKSAIVTIHSLEQLGANFKKILHFIMRSKPSIVLHYEPIMEFYDQGDMLDYLAHIYCRKRRYLYGFLPMLLEMEKKKKIKILECRRPFLGGIIHEMSVVIWKPL